MQIVSKLAGNMKLGTDFVDKMDMVLRDLRADFDVASTEHSKKKITELKNVHVDVTGSISTLASLAVASNGLVKGLRGTGKSHLLLIARDKINIQRNSLCIYINLKEQLNIGGTAVVEERFYVWALLKQLKKQLLLLTNSDDETLVEKAMESFASFFNISKKANAEKRLNKILGELDKLISVGEKEMIIFSKSKSASVTNENTANAKASTDLTKLNIEYNEGIKDTATNSEQYNATILLSISSLQELLVAIVELLDLNSIVFFYDEWSMLSEKDQHILSKLVRSLSTSPIYHWLAYVPYKSSLGVLELTSDMPHQIDLDLQFIYEENNNICRDYFNQFINKRLQVVFETGDFTIHSLISPKLFGLLVQASMGNTRDFGVMLNKAWNNYKQDYKTSGGKNRVISKKHVVNAIKSLANEKLQNLQSHSSNYSEKLWAEINRFIGIKKYTHFCIELNKENQKFINEEELVNLLYHRLVHLRKKDIPAKDGDEWRLALYAVDVSVLFSRIYETKSESRKIKLVTDLNIIHNQIRRYVFNLSEVINEFRIEQGKQINCPSCKRIISEDMKLAWLQGICPFCTNALPIQGQLGA